jgi:hypothetical protein
LHSQRCTALKAELADAVENARVQKELVEKTAREHSTALQRLSRLQATLEDKIAELESVKQDAAQV